jgi:phosphatidyl-myo-inositol dimannoside synthase
MAPGLNIVMLLTDGFGGLGGIAQFNRDFLQALDASPSVKRVRVFPRLIPARIEEEMPESVVYDRAAAKGRIAFLLRLAGCAWRGERTDLVVCGHLHLLPLGWLLARLRGARLALIIHGIEAWGLSGKFLAGLLARQVDSFISVSRYSAERFTRWSRVSTDRAFILPNCVDLQRFHPQQRDNALAARYGLETSKVILTVGRLAPQERYKGFDEVIDLMPRLLKQFSTLKYLIVGDGADRPRLEAKVGALGLSKNVVFAGHIAESEKIAHYNLADAYVMPSSGEGFGIVLIEAVACGVPVIGSKVDGSREALLQGRLGRLVDPRDPQRLFEAMTAALGENSSHRRIDAIDFFDARNFRARVADWCAAQAMHVAA